MSKLAGTLRRICTGPTPQLDETLREELIAIAEAGEIGAFRDLALRQRMGPWVAEALALDARMADDARFVELRQACAGQAFEALILYGELARVLSSLNACSIDTIVLKGPAVAIQFYANPGLRPYGDIDILIHERDLPEISSLLESWGYRDKNADEHPGRLHECHGIFQRIFIHPDGRLVEVHCDHLRVGLEPIGMDATWQRSCEMRFGKATGRVLEQHDLFIQLAVHLQRHGFERLIWFKDLDLMVRRGELDWERIRTEAQREDCAEIVGYVLYVLQSVLDTPLPAQAEALIGAESRVARFLPGFACTGAGTAAAMAPPTCDPVRAGNRVGARRTSIAVLHRQAHGQDQGAGVCITRPEARLSRARLLNSTAPSSMWSSQRQKSSCTVAARARGRTKLLLSPQHSTWRCQLYRVFITLLTPGTVNYPVSFSMEFARGL